MAGSWGGLDQEDDRGKTSEWRAVRDPGRRSGDLRQAWQPGGRRATRDPGSGTPSGLLDFDSSGKEKFRAIAKGEKDVETRFALMAGIQERGIGGALTTMAAGSRHHRYVPISSQAQHIGSRIPESKKHTKQKKEDDRLLRRQPGQIASSSCCR